jgi:hypothetical protein
MKYARYYSVPRDYLHRRTLQDFRRSSVPKQAKKPCPVRDRPIPNSPKPSWPRNWPLRCRGEHLCKLRLIFRRRRIANAGLEQVEHFARIGVAAQRFLGEEQLAVHRHLEHPAAGWHQLERADDKLIRFEQLVGEAHGPRGVVSMGAVDNAEGVHSFTFGVIIALYGKLTTPSATRWSSAAPGPLAGRRLPVSGSYRPTQSV